MKKCDFYGDECGGIKKDLKEFQRKQYESFLKNQQKARDLRADKHRAKDNHFEAKKL